MIDMIDLVGITPIEKVFYNMAKMDARLQEYFFTYYSQKLILLNHFYPHVEGKLRGFPDHGPDHIVRIMELHGKLLKNNILGLSDPQETVSDATLNFYEIYLLLSATVWHDVGNLLGRYKHNQNITKISSRLKDNYFPNKDLKKYVFQIAKAHTGPEGITREIPIEDADYKNAEIHLRFLGAVLRFADELEEGGVRVDETYYETMKDKIPNNKKIFWETCCCINRIEPKPSECIVQLCAKVDKDKLFKLFTKNGKNVALIDELVFRIDKINLERKYFMQFVRKHVEYREILFDLTVEDSRPDKFTFRLDNDQGYHDFWNHYSQLNPRINLSSYTFQKEMIE